VPDFPAARGLRQANETTAPTGALSRRVVHAAELNAMGLIDEILHHAVEIYRRTVNPHVMSVLSPRSKRSCSRRSWIARWPSSSNSSPPLAVIRDGQDPVAYLAGETEGHTNRAIALEELLMLWLANANPAFSTFDELFDDADLVDRTAYGEPDCRVAGVLRTASRASALRDCRSSPSSRRPRWPRRTRWPDSFATSARAGGSFSTSFLDRLIVSLDVIHEEEVALWMRTHPTPGPAPSIVGPGLGGLENEYEKFSQDREWMPRVVLMAKTTYVWLDQLSKRYGRSISRLDEIPDEELEALGGAGFTALWLIGLWERSRASQRIKAVARKPGRGRVGLLADGTTASPTI